MKYILTTQLWVLFTTISVAQTFGYQLRGTYAKPIEKEILASAESLSDINPGYPSSWIKDTDYISVVVKTTSENKVEKAVGSNSTLNQEQKRILNFTSIGSDVDIEVKYNSQNSVTGKIEIKTMHFSYSLAPEVQAHYPGGDQQINKYLEENVIHKISESKAKKLDLAIIRFIVDEQGKTTNIQISESSKDEGIDKLLIQAIQNMTVWTPAENAEGVRIKQDFELRVGNEIGC